MGLAFYAMQGDKKSSFFEVLVFREKTKQFHGQKAKYTVFGN